MGLCPAPDETPLPRASALLLRASRSSSRRRCSAASNIFCCWARCCCLRSVAGLAVIWDSGLDLGCLKWSRMERYPIVSAALLGNPKQGQLG
ncbi:hypothetical protein BU16DRAFT_330678 [Lophium mytilinum]|uniref:Uncharacterized protein n=1 Tax=Lophium mytilinum TaxID=390894 RepID=A0A6A6R156_9PEZI|nr:hypothetical protein BU16DRAFT_330678 [Lophium mytilinum]